MGRPFVSIEKALDILFIYNSRDSEFSANEISEKLGMPLSSTYRYLEIFINRGILTKNGDTNKISLGLSILKLGILAGEKISLIGVARPFMVTLAEKSRETVILTIVHGLGAMCVDTIESTKMVRLTMKPGATIPLHAGSTSKILLAYQNDSIVDEVINVAGLEKINTNTITDSAILKKELQLIRTQGFAQSESEVDSDAASIAAPIFDYTDKIMAGLTVAGPTERIKNHDHRELVDMVCGFARQVSIALGCTLYDQE